MNINDISWRKRVVYISNVFKIILDELHSFHKTRMDAIDSIDSKAYSILSATGIIASFYIGLSALIFDKYKSIELFTLWSILFIIATSFIVLTSFFCLKTIQISYVKYGPDPNWLFSISNENEDDVLLKIIDVYKTDIELKNSVINARKAFWIKNSIVTLTFGIFFIILSSLLLMIILYKLDYLLGILIIILTPIIFYLSLLVIKTGEEPYIKKYS